MSNSGAVDRAKRNAGRRLAASRMDLDRRAGQDWSAALKSRGNPAPARGYLSAHGPSRAARRKKVWKSGSDPWHVGFITGWLTGGR